ncbi:MAG: type II secretion system protein GspG [Acidobacteria bacterium]|nr:type II secretion system protein GspG [Acidobacteriota bacterium]
MKHLRRIVNSTLACLGLFCLIACVVYAADKGLSKDEARKLIANLAGLELKKDAVNVTEVSTLGSSATVVAQVETAFRFVKQNGKWYVVEIRTGEGKWEDVELLARALNTEKIARARAELETLAAALEAFRRERGFYVAVEDESALVDHLHPHHLQSVIRFDPWHRSYEYEGTRDSYTLRSTGPDGKARTPDDVTINRGVRGQGLVKVELRFQISN